MLRHKNTNRLYTHWAEKRHGGEPPQRNHIEPAAIAPALGNSAVLEQRADQAYSFRLAGSRLAAIFGYELTDDSITALFCTADHKMINQGLTAVAHEHTAMIIETAGYTQKGRVVAFECVFLPVIDLQPSIVAVIQNMTTPLWIGSEPVIAMETRSLRMMDLDRELLSLGNRPASLFPADRNPAPYFGSIDEHKTHARFSVIDGNGGHTTTTPPPQFSVVEGGRA